jgi:hypothetical protein
MLLAGGKAGEGGNGIWEGEKLKFNFQCPESPLGNQEPLTLSECAVTILILLRTV